MGGRGVQVPPPTGFVLCPLLLVEPCFSPSRDPCTLSRGTVLRHPRGSVRSRAGPLLLFCRRGCSQTPVFLLLRAQPPGGMAVLGCSRPRRHPRRAPRSCPRHVSRVQASLGIPSNRFSSTRLRLHGLIAIPGLTGWVVWADRSLDWALQTQVCGARTRKRGLSAPSRTQRTSQAFSAPRQMESPARSLGRPWMGCLPTPKACVAPQTRPRHFSAASPRRTLGAAASPHAQVSRDSLSWAHRSVHLLMPRRPVRWPPTSPISKIPSLIRQP
mmetsp:Transcript_22570/g.54028  ORF Transcript_22570/g.54028 Transcript_22570/m.54028 type:complete len:271 (+) Transcript_22570:387-1199(+)